MVRAGSVIMAAAMVLAAWLAPAGAAEKIAIGYLPVADSLAAYVAKDQGFFAAHGIDADFKMLAITSNMPSVLVGDSVQVGSQTLSTLLLAVDNGLDFKIVAGCAATAPGYHLAGILVRPDIAAGTAKDLEGRSVGVPGLNAFLHILLVKWLADHGADPAKVHFVELGFPQMPDALKARQVDAVAAVNPFLSRIADSGAGRLLSYYTDELPQGTVPSVWTVTADYAAAHPAVVTGFQAAIVEGAAYAQAHPEAGEAALAHYVQLPPAILKTIPTPPLMPVVDARQVAFWVDIMMQQKLLAHPVDPASLLAR